MPRLRAFGRKKTPPDGRNKDPIFRKRTLVFAAVAPRTAIGQRTSAYEAAFKKAKKKPQFRQYFLENSNHFQPSLETGNNVPGSASDRKNIWTITLGRAKFHGWNGEIQIPFHRCFITNFKHPIRRLQYNRSPQGCCFSGSISLFIMSMSASANLKATPYGSVDFVDIRQSNLAYVDKTRFIEALEDCGSKYPFIVRPRRFGKTLSTSMLEAYYDEAAADQFESLFAGTYIGSHKTPLAGRFRVLHLDFSGIAAEDPRILVESFQSSVLSSVQDYFNRYPHPKQDWILQGSFNSPASLIERFFALFSGELSRKFYIVIDEYDQFANEILSRDLDHFKAITSSEGFLKNFFAKLKAATRTVVSRIFITGVTSISLDSMTSGFNICANVTNFPAFTDLFGFTEGELRALIPQVLDLRRSQADLDDLTARMKEWYNGYRFSPYSDVTVFNPTMCLSYLNTWRNIGKEPASLLDPNLGQDLRKIESILRLGDADFVRKTVELALRREPIEFSGTLQTLNLNQEARLDNEALLSAMFYFGYLTYGSGGTTSLVIPNRAVSIQFFEYFLKHVLNADRYTFIAADFLRALEALIAGDPKPLFDVTCNRFQAASGLHSHAHLRESDFQTLIIGALNFTNAYTVTSEVEVRGEEKGYIDILATPSCESRAKTSYLIEVKYLPARKATPEAQAEALSKARAQISRYEQGDNVKHLPQLKRIVALLVGLKLETLEIVGAKAPDTACID